MDPSPPTDPPMAPAEMCEMVGRLIFRGLPVPESVFLFAGGCRPWLQLQSADLEEWAEQVAAVGEWTTHGNKEHYRGHAGGFDLIAVRDHVCAVTP